MSTLGWNNVVSTLYQHWETLFRRCVRLFQRCFNVRHWRCINVVQRWKSDVRFCFIFNVASTLFQRWSDVEILATETWYWRRTRKVWIYELIKTWLYTEIVLWVLNIQWPCLNSFWFWGLMIFLLDFLNCKCLNSGF